MNLGPMHRRRARVAITTCLALLIGGGATFVAVSRGDSAPAQTVASVATSTTAAPSTTTSTAPPTTTTLRLPHPTPPPANPYADVPVTQIGTVSIPKIGLVHPIFQGVWLTVVDHGPGHWPGTAMPGRVGNTVFAGHRVTHTHPFLNVDQLAPGDKVIFDMTYGTYTYAVTSITIVYPNQLSIIDQTATPTMTLFACHPKHSAAQRIVVKGKLVHSQRKGPAPQQ
jgi:sortase A